MAARGQTRGHPIYFDEEAAVWCYEDDDEPIAGYGGDERPCVACGETVSKDDPRDPCLRGLPEQVEHACCGHGVEEGYIIWDSDTPPRETLIPLGRLKEAGRAVLPPNKLRQLLERLT